MKTGDETKPIANGARDSVLSNLTDRDIEHVQRATRRATVEECIKVAVAWWPDKFWVARRNCVAAMESLVENG